MYGSTLIIIPAYNEEAMIGTVVSSVRKLYPGISVVVVNDGSADNTAKAAREAGAVVLTHPFNMGYGVSLQTGYKYAVRQDYSYVVQIDGDGQHDPKGIGKLLQVVTSGTADVALGSRFLHAGSYRPSLVRLLGIRLFRFVLWVLSGRRIMDVTTGFQAMNRGVLKVFISDAFPCDYPDADVILLLSKLGFTVSEVPVTMYPSASGKSMHQNPVKVLYYIFKMLLSLLLTRIRNDTVLRKRMK